MKKFLIFLLSLLITTINILLVPSFAIALEPPEITAPSGVLIDAETGNILYDKNAHEPMYPASTTKVMTAILAIENASLDDKVIIDKDTPFTEGSRIYVIEDEVLTVEQLLYALLLNSANDAAVALAKHVSGSTEEFVLLMNRRAKELGAKNTNFVNPNGLPDDDHISTAYDLAIIAKHGMTLPKFAEIVSTVNYQIPPTNKQVETRYLKNSNRFLWGTGSRNKIDYRNAWIDIKYDAIEGIKTGYTSKAQQCLVASASKDEHRFISVVLKAQGANIYSDTRALIDYGLENFEFVKITDSKTKIQSIPIKNGTEKYIDLITQTPLYKAMLNEQELSSLQTQIHLDEDVVAPINEGDIIGKIIYTSNDEYVGQVNLVASKSISAKTGPISSLSSGLNSGASIFKKLLWLLLLFIIWRTIITLRRVNRRNRKNLFKNKASQKQIRPISFEKTYLYNKKDTK